MGWYLDHIIWLASLYPVAKFQDFLPPLEEDPHNSFLAFKKDICRFYDPDTPNYTNCVDDPFFLPLPELGWPLPEFKKTLSYKPETHWEYLLEPMTTSGDSLEAPAPNTMAVCKPKTHWECLVKPTNTVADCEAKAYRECFIHNGFDFYPDPPRKLDFHTDIEDVAEHSKNADVVKECLSKSTTTGEGAPEPSDTLLGCLSKIYGECCVYIGFEPNPIPLPRLESHESKAKSAKNKKGKRRTGKTGKRRFF